MKNTKIVSINTRLISHTRACNSFLLNDHDTRSCSFFNDEKNVLNLNDRVDHPKQFVDYGKRLFRSYQHKRVVLFKQWENDFKSKHLC